MFPHKKIFVAGHKGLVGSAIVRKLQFENFDHIVTRSRLELDLTNQHAVNNFFEKEKPEIVFLAAGKVGGIHANSTYPADFIRDNLLIEINIIDAAYRNQVERLIYLGSSCIYPKNAPQPLKEEYLLTSVLESTNEAYAMAKISGIKMCQAYEKQYGFNSISLMPTNLYGFNDNFDLSNGHVLPALIRKIHEAKRADAKYVEIWGTGNPKREFLNVDDLAAACFLLMNESKETLKEIAPDGIINVGAGEDLTIRELANLICRVIGLEGELKFNDSMPDGTMRKLLDISRISKLGWKPQLSLEIGLAQTYKWYNENVQTARA